MKKIILATVAFSLIATPAAFAQNRGSQQHHSDKDWKKPQYKKQRWSKGQRLDREHRRHVVRDYHRYHLRQPPRGYQWVEVDGDFVLVAVATGIISSIIGAAIYNN